MKKPTSLIWLGFKLQITFGCVQQCHCRSDTQCNAFQLAPKEQRKSMKIGGIRTHCRNWSCTATVTRLEMWQASGMGVFTKNACEASQRAIVLTESGNPRRYSGGRIKKHNLVIKFLPFAVLRILHVMLRISLQHERHGFPVPIKHHGRFTHNK